MTASEEPVPASPSQQASSQQAQEKRRNLRSVDSNLHSTLLDYTTGANKDLFDFDPYLKEKLPADKPIYVSVEAAEDEINYDKYLHMNKDLTLDQDALVEAANLKIRIFDEEDEEETTEGQPNKRRRRRTTRTRVTKRDEKALPGERTKKLVDPLDDTVYMAYYNKMEKEEKRMANLDKSSTASEYAKFEEQLQILNVNKFKSILLRGKDQHNREEGEENAYIVAESLHAFLTNPFEDMTRKLCTVTRLNDVRNYEELKLKYKLTIKELIEFTMTHLKLKKLETELKKKAFVPDDDDYDDDDSDDEEDAMMDVEELQEKRLQKRALKFGKPIIKIIFYDCVLIIDPIHPPRIRSI